MESCIQACEFVIAIDAEADCFLDGSCNEPGGCEGEESNDDDGNCLSGELCGAAIEEEAIGACFIGGDCGNQSDGEHAEDSADSVNANDIE